MKGAAEFCLDWLVEKDGVLVTAPSTSPENVYILPNGTKGAVTIGSAMDMEIIWDLFTNLIEASNILGIDKTFAKLLKQKRSKLSPLMIGKKGNLVEWHGDWEDEDPQHRHVSGVSHRPQRCGAVGHVEAVHHLTRSVEHATSMYLSDTQSIPATTPFTSTSSRSS